MSLKKNIIYLHFKGKHLITSKSQYQYNYGQYLYFADLNLPQAFEVHFSNKERGESETQIGSNKLVEIPDKYFWNSALEIYAWVYLHDETNDGKTIYEVRIPLIKRARPTDKEPLPNQQSAIDKAIAELNNALNITNENADKTNADKTQVATIKEEVVTLKEEIDSTANAVSQDAQSANTAAERSEQSAQNSAESERKALDYSDEAKGYAQSAFESKNTASQKAQVATNASAEAKDFRDEAETFKNEAEQIKQNVVDYRNETKGYRDEALTAKNDAQDSVNTVQKTSEQMTQAGAEIIENVRDVGSKYAAQAETAASNAQTSAESASVSATASAQSASQSAQIKSDVEDLVDDAQGYASASAQSASASANSASQAQGYAQSASASAQSASGYASNAQTSANTASTKAQDASTSAQTASTKATEASQSATTASNKATEASGYATASQTAQGLAESARDSAISAKNDAEQAKADAESARDEAQQAVASISGALDDKAPVITDTASGAIASFTDGADDLPLKSLVIDINPIQDLHGQDNPYPAGGGKNLASDIPSEYSRAADYWTFPLPLEQGKTYTIWCEMVSDTVTGYAFGIAKSGTRYSDFDSLNLRLSTNGTVYPPASFTVDATYTAPVLAIYAGDTQDTLAEFMSKVRFQVEEGSANTSYAPYSNICPISGWTEVDVEQSGVNVWDEEWELGTFSTTTGQNIDTGQALRQIRAKRLIPVAAENEYYLTTSIGVWTMFFDIDKNVIAPPSGVHGKVNNCIRIGGDTLEPFNKFTPPQGCAYIRFYCQGAYGETYNHDISINYPSTDHSYHPYTGRSITIQLGQTVYGGKLDVLSGELVVDRAMFTLDSSLNMDKYIYKDMNGVMCQNALSGKQTRLKGISSHSGLVGNYFTSNSIWLGVNDGNIFWIGILDILGMSTISEFKAWLDTQSVQFCYELAEPIEIQLSANQLNSLYGVNNLWADSGDTEVEYRADTKLFIERLTAPDSADMIADANITSGKYFMVGNSLYKATANIANGSAIVVGTNCTRKSLSEALNEINA